MDLAVGIRELGPIGVWAGAFATLFVAVIALLAGFHVFEQIGAPRVRITFDQREPWCRATKDAGPGETLWVRVGVENRGRHTARGCIGRITRLATNGVAREDIDPLQLRWAGIPRSRAFDPVDLRKDEREFLDVLLLRGESAWRIVTFGDADFEPGFSTELPTGQEHELEVGIFADDLDTVTRSLVARPGAGGGAMTVYLKE